MQKKNNHQFTIAEALQLLVSDKRINKGISESLIREQWSTIMGDMIAKHTTLLFVKGNELHIYFNSAIIKNEFLYNKPKAIALVNEALGYELINDIVIR